MRSKRFFGPYRYARNTAKLPSFSSPAPRAISARSRGEKNTIAKKTLLGSLLLSTKQSEARAVFFPALDTNGARPRGEKNAITKKTLFGSLPLRSKHSEAPAFFFSGPWYDWRAIAGRKKRHCEGNALLASSAAHETQRITRRFFPAPGTISARLQGGKRHCEENASAPTATLET